MTLDHYFSKFQENLVYLNMNSKRAKDSYKDLLDLPLPLLQSDLLFGIQGGSFEEEIDINLLMKGMVYQIGVNPNFPHAKRYKKLLEQWLQEPKDFALFFMNKASQENRLDDSLIYLRAASQLQEDDLALKARFLGAYWQMSKKEEDILLASRLLEEIYAKEDFDEVKFQLGLLNEGIGNYQKALSYYKLCDDEQLVKEAKDRIYVNALIEEGNYFMHRANFERALEVFHKAEEANPQRYDIAYFLARVYYHLELYENAKLFFEKALSLGGDFEDLYVDAFIIYILLGDRKSAIEIGKKGLEVHPHSLRLHHNLAIFYSEMKDWDHSLEHIEYILSFDDISDELFNQVMLLKEYIDANTNK